ncbi:unnamed protein product [Thlaspi arvense]|uniref:START domain-containing protein n=1 Tax=Thlaspi arvense TaxID=13288 RepID=A0AAU9T9C6_THLAR|nr:unnamed protein product [Thlaspi arvense]
MDITQLTETVASAVRELKHLFFTEEAFWVKSSMDGTYVIDQESYEKFLHAIKNFRSLSARIVFSKNATVVPIEATNLIEMFLDSEKWKNLFPSIVNKATTIQMLGSELPIIENCDVLQVIFNSSLGYGAKHWIVTLEWMDLPSILTIPATDWSEGTYHLSSELNRLTILRPKQTENSCISMAQYSLKDDIVMLQDCFIDAQGGVIAYAPLNVTAMNIAASGRVDPARIPILPSGFSISSDGQRSM